MTTNYISRLRHLLDTVRKLEPTSRSPEIERELAEFEQELQAAATEMTIQACRQEIARQPQDRRRSAVPVAVDRRLRRRGAAATWPRRPSIAGKSPAAPGPHPLPRTRHSDASLAGGLHGHAPHTDVDGDEEALDPVRLVSAFRIGVFRGSRIGQAFRASARTGCPWR